METASLYNYKGKVCVQLTLQTQPVWEYTEYVDVDVDVGETVGYITPSRGLRQGDPISPYLFLIFTEALSALISTAAEGGIFRGLRLARGGPLLTHLLFADDLLILCKADEGQAVLLTDLLDLYGKFSGQKINLSKSTTFFSKNTAIPVRSRICEVLDGLTAHNSSRYLGLPFGIGKSKREAFDFVIETVRKRLESWKNKYLSTTGKEVLIKVVINSLPVFTMSCFKLTDGICNVIASTTAQFWWSKGKNHEKGIHWRNWNLLTVPKKNGGLGFQDLKLFNEALLLKQLWRITSKPDLLVSKILKSRYFSHSSIFQAVRKASSSWLWNNWMQVLPTFKTYSWKEIRPGNSTKISDGGWVPRLGGLAPALQNDNNLDTAGTNPLWVHELMEESGQKWKTELVKKLFSEHDGIAILEIDTLDPHKEDTWRWDLNKKGLFTVADSYSFFIKEKVKLLDIAESRSAVKVDCSVRDRSWKLKIKGRIKHFIWKCFTGTLPVGVNLRKKGIEVDVICKVCGEAEETIEHLLLNCGKAKIVWKLAQSLGKELLYKI